MTIGWILGHVIATAIGISLGLIGGGGSILAVPTLVYVMGVPPKSAIAMSLAIVGTVSFLGAIPHWKLGNIQLKTAGMFGLSTMLGAYAGARLATLPFVTGTLQMMLFGTMMLLAAAFMIRKHPQTDSPVGEPDLELYPKPVCRYCWLWLVSEGIGVGALTGLVGVGGGFAIVPALVLLAKVPMKQAIGTSLLVIVLNSIAGFFGYLGRVNLNWELIATFTVAASLGIIAGAYLVRFVQARHLQKAFGYFLLVMSAFIFWQNRTEFHSQKIQRQLPVGQVEPASGTPNFHSDSINRNI
ncbi:permease [Chroococcidiopsis sp. CCALA 051]|uniref:sulfite exporter TauE/SafE family protein n=1 Tax=Chroococcidiopsis sp. CCALA 051 TaxID=869949 RepID=UPI000D0D7D74|nr:sulfite exporter TauE/SafE family protein [Chroococcidiopsis sp. CCALA 051]MBE9014777.1 sulfite exporter TauE/SafE family protein [Chroococcidiopsidales cyanobacterium LEGE 13417]PSM45782.1 permease [Chroococcidiopsis sp. CCALA 051]